MNKTLLSILIAVIVVGLIVGAVINISYIYYGVWILILVAQLVAYILGWSVNGMFKRDKEFFSNWLTEDGELNNEVVAKYSEKDVIGKVVKYIGVILLSIGVSIWQGLGLLTDNWVVFLSMFLIGMIVYGINKLFEPNMGKTDAEKIRAAVNYEQALPIKGLNYLWQVVRFALILFAILNAFHLHINLQEWVTNLFG